VPGFGMPGLGRLDVVVLLEPEPAIERAAVEKLAMAADIDGAALVQHRDRIGRGQRGEPVGDRDDRPALGAEASRLSRRSCRGA
jgi:hypothetical protein